MPFAPGTAGSFVALFPALWLLSVFGLFGLLGAWLLLMPLACWSTYIALPVSPDKDPGWVVIDEWLGQWLSLLIFLPLVGLSWWSLGLAFVAFRIFDIWKPWLVRRAEHIGPAWWSIHADDLLAGLFAGVLLVVGNGLLRLFV